MIYIIILLNKWGEKMNQKKYTISEAAKLLEYEPHVLRYYEGEFEIQVPRDKGKRREYTIKEIESFEYIKSLKEQGFNNNQIKQILKSPTIENDENNLENNVPNTITKDDREIALTLDYMNKNFVNYFQEINKSICSLKEEIEVLRKSHDNDENDVLLSENAKLKMRLKEKSYELVDIKDKFSRLEKKKFLFKRFFK